MSRSPAAEVPWRHLGHAEREREYSPSSVIGGDYQPFIAAYRRRSHAGRERAIGLGARWLDCQYGAGASRRLQLCLPAPRGTRAPGLLVFIHGGYWQELSARDSLFPAAQCVERDLAYAAIDYPLAPAATLGEIVADCRRALAWLYARAGALGIDPARIVVAGSSAGAHLAAMTAMAALGADDPGRCPRALVLLSGIYELEPLIGTTINDALKLDLATAHAHSPLRQGLAGFPEALIAWGEIETAAFKAQSRAFGAALQRAGTPCTSFEIAQRNHFDVVFDLADAHTELGRSTLALLGAA